MVSAIIDKSQEEEVALNVRNLPRDIRDRFKSHCAKQSISMQDAVRILLELAVRTDINLEAADAAE